MLRKSRFLGNAAQDIVVGERGRCVRYGLHSVRADPLNSQAGEGKLPREALGLQLPQPLKLRKGPMATAVCLCPSLRGRLETSELPHPSRNSGKVRDPQFSSFQEQVCRAGLLVGSPCWPSRAQWVSGWQRLEEKVSFQSRVLEPGLLKITRITLHTLREGDFQSNTHTIPQPISQMPTVQALGGSAVMGPQPWSGCPEAYDKAKTSCLPH